MAEKQPKKWWQTLPALMSGLGSLLVGIGAVLGFFLGSHQADRGSDGNAVMEGRASIVPESPAGSRKASVEQPSARAKAPKPQERRQAAPLEEPAEPAITRQAYLLTLPTKREYEFTSAAGRAVYTLLRAKVTPQTPESDLLKVSVRVLNRNRPENYFVALSGRFELITEEKTFKAEDFAVMVPGQQTRDVDAAFYIPAGLGEAKLRMALWDDALVDIPLDVTMPVAAERAVNGEGVASTD